MTGEAATIAVTIQTVQTLFTSLATLSLTDYRYPTTASVSDGDTFDFIIAGGGTAGCVVANRLTENGKYSVLMIEQGPVPPLESQYVGLFPVLPESDYDYNFNATNDGYAAQSTQTKAVSLTAGKMLGGSSGLNHAIMVNGTVGDYALWATAANDSSWNYTSLQTYVEKITNVIGVSESKGNLKLTKVTNSANDPYIQSFVEMGYTYTENADANQIGGVEDPLISAYDDRRQSTADAYITPILNRTNLKILYESTVVKINFDDDKVATGVQVIDSSGNNITIGVNKEVILTAGAIGSPQILMLSGVGPAENLEANDITVVADVPVGTVLRDHPSAMMCFATETANVSTDPVNYGTFPVPVLCSYKKDSNDSDLSNYQSIPLLFPPQSSASLELYYQVFKYNTTTCDTLYEASESRNMWCLVQNLLHPVSTGNLTLQSSDYTVQPQINLGLYSNETDLVKMATYMQGFYNDIMNTTYFKSVNAELVDVIDSDYDKTSYEYWEEFTRIMSNTMWHYSSTCLMGLVTDNELRVKNVTGVRVGDASAVPDLISGNIQMSVMVLAEKLSAMILSELESST